VMRVAVAHEVVSGLATRPAWGAMFGKQATSEQALTKIILERLPPQCYVMGDRNYGVFSMAYHATCHGHRCLFRLSEPRARKLNGGIPPAAKTNRVVCWRPSRDDLRNNPEIPPDALVEGRLMAFKINLGGRLEKIYLFTTLDVPPKQALHIYGYRWNIETDLRSLKREVRLHMLHVQSPAMAHKELVAGVAAYNLTRQAMNEAATALQIDPREFSFSLAQDTINAFLPLLASAKTERQRKSIMKEMLRVFSYSKLPKRKKKRRSFPRAVWPRTCSFPKRKTTDAQ
jgi:putative transposase